MIRLTFAGLFLLMACIVAPLHAQDDDEPADFAALEASTDAADADAVKRARAALEAADPAFWHDLHPPGPFRTALARSFAPDDVRQRLDAVAADPDAMATTAWNLVSRHDLGALLAEDGRFRPLVKEHSGLLEDLAVEDLWEGRRELGTAILGNVETTESAAEDLAHRGSPGGLRLVADVILGKVPVPAAALAEIARADPTRYGPRRHKPLGDERVAALVSVARTHEDPRMSVLAARVLELAADAGLATVEAWSAVRSPESSAEAWWLVARHAPQLLPIAEAPEHAMLSAIVGEMAFGYVYAEDDFAHAESAAQRIAAMYGRASDPRVRAGLLVNFEYLGSKLVVEDLRQHPVPAWRAFLESLETPRESDPPLLRELSRRIATRLLTSLDHEAVPRSGNRARKSPLPRRETRPAPDDWAAALVGAADDPAALLDLAEVYARERGLDWSVRAPGESERAPLRTLLDACPDSRVARLAADLLARSAPIDDLVLVLRRAERLAFDEPEDGFWVPDLSERVLTDGERERMLELVADSSISAAVRARAMAFAWQDVPEWEDDETRSSPETLARLTEWYETVAPTLDAGLAEAALAGAIDDAWNREAWEIPGHEEFMSRIRAAIAKVPAEGPRLRLLRLLDTTE